MNLGNEIKTLYSGLMGEYINKYSDDVLLVYPYIDEALYANGAENYDSEGVVVLFLPELEEIPDKYGLDNYFTILNTHIGELEHFLKNPNEINDDTIARLRKNSEILPNETYLDDLFWCQLPSLKVYGHDKKSKDDLKIATSFLVNLASFADSKEDFEGPDIEDELFQALLEEGDGEEEAEETDVESIDVSEETEEEFPDAFEEDDDDDEEDPLDMLLRETDEEDDEEFGRLTPEQLQRYRIAEIRNFRYQYDAVKKLLKDMYRN